MGNSLCRERIARADNSKNPIDRIIGRCAQICPANEVKSNYWQKHVFETGPPTRTQPHSTLNDGWRKVTLTVPNGKTGMSDGDLGETPIAPPRRKRSSVIDRQPCGFKELFGNNVSRRSSCDSILRDDAPLTDREQEILQQKRKSKSISDFNLNEIKATDSLSISTIRIPVTRTLSLMERAMVQQTMSPAPRPTLQRKVSRVGNKKSDKFFGENLSDCLSDDPITPDPEPTSISFTYHTISTLITPISHSTIDSHDKTIDLNDTISDINANTTANANVNVIDSKDKNTNEVNDMIFSIPKPFIVSEHINDTKPDGDRKTSLDKKAEFLMAMLEGTNLSFASTVESKVVTPPRRSHIKKKTNQAPIGIDNSITINNESVDISDKNGIENETLASVKIEPLNNAEISTDKQIMLTNGIESNPMVKINSNNNDDDLYKGMTPVEEPLIVPRRRSTKHICDGGDHHNHNHHHHHQHHHHNHPRIHNSAENNDVSTIENENENENKENETNMSNKETAANVEKYIIQQVNGVHIPDKPKRDFSVYEREQQNDQNLLAATPSTTITLDVSAKPIPRVRHLSQENLMSRKILKTMSNDTIDLLRIKSMQNNNNKYDINKLNGNDVTLKKHTSQQSFFTEELLSQIADRVYGFQDPFDTLESDDGSLKCTPNSKLTTRKISTHRKESTVTRPILENEFEVDATPKIIQMEQKELQSPLHSSPTQNQNDQLINHHVNNIQVNIKLLNDAKNTHVIDNFISIEREHSMVCDANKPEANVNLTPNECKSNNTEVIVSATHENEVQNTNHVLDDIYKVNNIILMEFHKNFNNSAIENEQTKNDCRLENGNSSDDDNTTDSDTTVKEVPIANNEDQMDIDIDIKKPMFKQINGGEKRGSIVEVDAWFLKHSDLSNLPRRSSESLIDYDTRKVFPFGKSDPGAGSEFFDNKTISKSVENILNEQNIQQTPIQMNNSNNTPSESDHSILLKYFNETH